VIAFVVIIIAVLTYNYLSSERSNKVNVSKATQSLETVKNDFKIDAEKNQEEILTDKEKEKKRAELNQTISGIFKFFRNAIIIIYFIFLAWFIFIHRWKNNSIVVPRKFKKEENVKNKEIEHESVFDIDWGEGIALFVFTAILILAWGLGNYFEGKINFVFSSLINIIIFSSLMSLDIFLMIISRISVPEQQRWMLEFQQNFQVVLLPGMHFILPFKHKVKTKKSFTIESDDEEGQSQDQVRTVETEEKIGVWHIPDYGKVELREETFDMSADDVLCSDGWRPRIDLVIAFATKDIDPNKPIRGDKARQKQPPCLRAYEFKSENGKDDFLQGLESEADTAARQHASLVPFVQPLDEEDLEEYRKKIKDNSLIALNESQLFLSRSVFRRLTNLTLREDVRPSIVENYRPKTRKEEKEEDEIIGERICEKGGVVLRSVQIKRIVPPEKYEETIRKLREAEISAQASIRTARGEEQRLKTVAEGQQAAITKRGDAYTGAIKKITDSGVSPNRAAQSFETLEGQRAWMEVANSPNKMIITGGPNGLPGAAATGAEILADSLSSNGAESSKKKKLDEKEKEGSDDKEE